MGNRRHSDRRRYGSSDTYITYALELCQNFSLEMDYRHWASEACGQGWLGQLRVNIQEIAVLAGWLQTSEASCLGLVYSLAPEAEGHSTDAAISAYHRLRGHIRRRVPFVKLVASSSGVAPAERAPRHN